MYWPVTAGGLALTHPTLRVASFLAGRETGPLPQLPDRELVAGYLRRKPAVLQGLPLNNDEIDYLIGLKDLPATGPSGSREALLADFHRRWEAGQAGPPTEEEEEKVAELWQECYRRLVKEVEPTAPPKLPAMEQLVNDFINRGTEVAGRKQQTLSPYWRWVVYTYGPSLLEALGTFRFLITELVPLQLILEARGGPAAELEGSGAGPASAPASARAAPARGPVARQGGSEDIPF
jgi:hypothetical protein